MMEIKIKGLIYVMYVDAYRYLMSHVSNLCISVGSGKAVLSMDSLIRELRKPDSSEAMLEQSSKKHWRV